MHLGSASRRRRISRTAVRLRVGRSVKVQLLAGGGEPARPCIAFKPNGFAKATVCVRSNKLLSQELQLIIVNSRYPGNRGQTYDVVKRLFQAIAITLPLEKALHSWAFPTRNL